MINKYVLLLPGQFLAPNDSFDQLLNFSKNNFLYSFNSIVDDFNNILSNIDSQYSIEHYLSYNNSLIYDSHYLHIHILAKLYLIYKTILLEYSELIDCFIGYSLGELLSYSFSNVISINKSFELFHIRGRVLRKCADNKLGMALVVIPRSFLKSYRYNTNFFIKKIFKYIIDNTDLKFISDFSDKVFVIGFNSYKHFVISGNIKYIKSFKKSSTLLGFHVVNINFSNAFHTKYCQIASKSFNYFLTKNLQFNYKILNNNILYSSFLNKRVTSDNINNAISNHMLSPVYWSDIITNIINMGYNNFIELGPNTYLNKTVKDIIFSTPNLSKDYLNSIRYYNINSIDSFINFKDSVANQ